MSNSIGNTQWTNNGPATVHLTYKGVGVLLGREATLGLSGTPTPELLSVFSFNLLKLMIHPGRPGSWSCVEGIQLH